VGRDCTAKAEDIATYLQACNSLDDVIKSPISTSADPIEYTKISTDFERQMASNGPGLVVFTSGTTGPPKAAVLPRTCFTNKQPVELGNASFSCRPGHWLGSSFELIGSALIGQKLYILEELTGNARLEALLDLFRHYQITNGLFSPPLLRGLRDALLNGKKQLSREESSYWSGRFGKLSTFRCTGAVIESSVRQFWMDLTGRPFVNLYGSTELGGAVLLGDSRVQVSSPWVQVLLWKSKTSHRVPLESQFPVFRLSCQKKTRVNYWSRVLPCLPSMLHRGLFRIICLVLTRERQYSYLDDAGSTKNAFDEDGYYKTGDMAEFKDEEYIFKGRFNADCQYTQIHQTYFNKLTIRSYQL
jgi:malonyl-CoA/methylmalonyl-CoA synthetase